MTEEGAETRNGGLDSSLQALKMEEGTTSRGMRRPLEAGLALSLQSGRKQGALL